MQKILKRVLIVLGVLAFLSLNLGISLYFYKKSERLERTLLSPSEQIQKFVQSECFNPYEASEIINTSESYEGLGGFFVWLGKHWQKNFVLQELQVKNDQGNYTIDMSIKLVGDWVEVQQASDRFLLGLAQVVHIASSNLTFYRKRHIKYAILKLKLEWKPS